MNHDIRRLRKTESAFTSYAHHFHTSEVCVLFLIGTLWSIPQQVLAFYDYTIFGGRYVGAKQENTVGGSLGLFAFSEFEVSVDNTSNFNMNLRLPLYLPEEEEMWYGLYLVGGGGKLDETAWNIGGGGWLAPWRLYEPWKKSGPVIRLDYRHFWVHHEDPIHRLYIGIWWSAYGPLYTD